MTDAELRDALADLTSWVRVEPGAVGEPDFVESVPDALGGIEDGMQPGESVTLRVRRDADDATVTLPRLEHGWDLTLLPYRNAA